MPTTIASRNRLVTIERIITFTDSLHKGVPQYAVESTVSRYAGVEQISNSYTLQSLGVHYGEAYRFTFREEPSFPIFVTDVIGYEGKRHKINGIRPEKEGNRRDLIITASVSNNSGLSGSPVPTPVKKELHLVGDVVIGGSDYSNWNGTILLFRDKMQYAVVRDGSATTEQVNYDASTGLFTFNTALPVIQPSEPVDVYFL